MRSPVVLHVREVPTKRKNIQNHSLKLAFGRQRTSSQDPKTRRQQKLINRQTTVQNHIPHTVSRHEVSFFIFRFSGSQATKLKVLGLTSWVGVSKLSVWQQRQCLACQNELVSVGLLSWNPSAFLHYPTLPPCLQAYLSNLHSLDHQKAPEILNCCSKCVHAEHRVQT